MKKTIIGLTLLSIMLLTTPAMAIYYYDSDGNCMWKRKQESHISGLPGNGTHTWTTTVTSQVSKLLCDGSMEQSGNPIQEHNSKVQKKRH